MSRDRDNYRPSNYDYGRRVSYSNRTWRAENSNFGQPQRPTGPSRANTMDPTRDPRRKRQQSRSPDGAAARKQLKPEHSRDVPAGPAVNNHSRRSSISNGTPQHPNGIGSSPSRRDSIQPLGNSNQGARSPLVNSLNGHDSPMRGNSGRSTPVNKPNGASTLSNKGPAASKSPLVHSNGDTATATPDLVLALLTNFSTEVARQASLQISCDQAQARADRLQLEYNSTRDKFAAFPAIKERKTRDKDAALKELGNRDVKLSEHKASQGELMSKLATVISQNASSTDHVSRADYDKLAKELDAATDLVKNLRTQCNDLKVTADAASTAAEGVSNRLESHQKATNTALEKVREEIGKVDTNFSLQKDLVKSIVPKAHGAATSKDLDEVKQSLKDLNIAVKAVDDLEQQRKLEREQFDAQVFTTVKQLEEVKKRVETFNDVVKRVEKVELKVENGAIPANNARNTDPSGGKPLADSTAIEDRFKDIEFDIAEINKMTVTQQNEFATYVEEQLNGVRNDFSSIAAANTTQLDDMKRLRETVPTLEKALTELQGSVSQKVTTEGLKAFEIGFHEELSGVKDDIKSIKTQQQHVRSASQSSMVPQPQYAPGSQQMSNGIAQSPQLPNGRNGSPSLQQRPSPRNGSPYGMAQPPTNATPDIHKKLQDLQTQYNQLVGVWQSLKQRCDNVTSDEVVNKMVLQMNSMYPTLSNYDAAVKSLRLDVNQEKLARERFVKEISQQLTDIKDVADRAFRLARESTTSGKTQEDLRKLNDTVGSLSAQILGLQPQLRKLGESTSSASETAKAADKLSKELDQKLTKASEKAEGAYKRVSTELEAVKKRLTEGEAAREASKV